jgi:uridine phosphorylase
VDDKILALSGIVVLTFSKGVQDLDIIALIPPMGASLLACVVEDLVVCGVDAIFLACAAWSLGPPIRFGDLIFPAFSIGLDGTSIHNSNTSGQAQTDPNVIETLATIYRQQGARAYVGSNALCEALYRIISAMVAGFRQHDCISMENGEASTLLAMARMLGFLGSVLFQPYIDLTQGWNPIPLREESYRSICRLQAEVVLEAGIRLKGQGMF